MKIGALLPRHARYRPDHVALVVGDRRLTYRELNAIVNRLANALLANGVIKGDKIATVLTNGLELMTAYWAAAKTGIVIVPMSTLLQEGGLAILLRDSDSIVLLADASFAETLDRIRGELPAMRADRFVLVGCEGNAPPGFRTYEDFTAAAAEDNPPDPGLTDVDIYNIMYSSGTTGRP
jgi:acyl-coenzyme A synthetase/AMP-(fatty) acid ligase